MSAIYVQGMMGWDENCWLDWTHIYLENVPVIYVVLFVSILTPQVAAEFDPLPDIPT